VLTGGSSRRLGRDKATLELAGERLADRAARVLAAVATRVVEVGPGITGLPACVEDPPGAGPLAALVAGAAALGDPPPAGVLLLACDLPGVDEAVLARIATWPGARTAVPVEGGRVQLVAARYGSDALDAAGELLRRGERSLRALVDRVRHDVIPEAAWRAAAGVKSSATFADVDTPADLARWRLRADR
jgi:molybdopterin-guanine dinucleotide biosynthesis protein A